MIKSVVLVFTATLCYAGSNIIRPCRLNPPDYACVRDNFAANSNCSRNVKGYLPREFVVPEFRAEVPWFNASIIEKPLIVRNSHRCFLTEFFFDMRRDISVISIDCPNYDLEAERLYLRHVTRNEDAEYKYHYRGVYPLIRLTMTIRNTDVMNACAAFTYCEVAGLPRFVVNPKDKPTANFLSRDLKALSIFEIENFLLRAGPIMKTFINGLICDFNCL